jgi:hypothetical protein
MQRGRLDIAQALPQAGADRQVSMIGIAPWRDYEEATASKLP